MARLGREGMTSPRGNRWLHQVSSRGPTRTLLLGTIATALLAVIGATLLLLRSDANGEFAATHPIGVPVLAAAQAPVVPVLPPRRAESISSDLAAKLSRTKAQTVLEGQSSIVGFAQDGDRIVWVDAYAPCSKKIKIRRVSGGAERSLVAKRGLTCRDHDVYFRYDALALAGTRALWEVVGFGNTVVYGSIRTASSRSRVEREIGRVDEVDKETYTPTPVAGDGTTLACACHGGAYALAPHGKFFTGSEGTNALAVSGGRVALVRPVDGGCACNSAPHWSPDGRTIFFASTGGAPYSEQAIYSIRADGAGLKRVSLPSEGVTGASLSPNGQFLLYTSRDAGDFKTEIFVVSRDGTGARRLAEGANARWSPDGRSVAYHDQSSSVLSYFVVPAHGGAPTRIGRGRSWLSSVSLGTLSSAPSWSPDGTKIALARSRGLFVVDLRARVPRPIFREKGDSQLFAHEWSPDGTRIAFLTSGSELDKPSHLHVVRSDGSGNDIELAEGDPRLYDGALAWSPDSSMIAFSLGPTIRLVSAAGGSSREVARGLYGGALAWSPDSSMIAFSLGPAAYEQPTIRLVSAAGGSSREVARGRDPAWSPDGQTLAYAAVPRISPQAEAQEGAEIARIARDGSFRLLTRTRPSPKRSAVEVRDVGTGKVVSAFNTATLPSAVALSGSRLALLVVKGSMTTIEIRRLDGSPVRTIAVPRPADDGIFMSGQWIVFKTSRTGVKIRAVHVQSGGKAVIARTKAEVVGLSIDGKRVAWAERGVTRSRIRMLDLP